MTTPGPPRKPVVFSADDPDIAVTPPRAATTATDAPADGATDAGDRDGPGEPDVAVAPSKPPGWGLLLLSSLAGLVLLAMGLWLTNLVSGVLVRDDWVGWTGRGLAALAALAALVLVLREVFGLMRLRRLASLRRDADAARRSGDRAAAQGVVNRLKGLARSRREARWDLDRFREEERHMATGSALLGLADRVLLAGADSEARRVVYQSARRIGVVSAVVPITAIVVLFVLIENLRMLRRLATVYGGNPGMFGGLRMLVWVIGHIAATGAIALTDDLWGQFFGQDLLRRVSARLGEGAFNGAMTARLGVAAIGLIRPLPFIEAKPPRARHVFYEAFPDLRPSAVTRKVWGRRSDNEPAGAD
ncbi:MAG: TIGR01620 family protein [Hyphomicrobiaceae bacterium]|nr:TIGR01620 family protein [Hyphomicrobiaceae bacterium]